MFILFSYYKVDNRGSVDKLVSDKWLVCLWNGGRWFY